MRQCLWVALQNCYCTSERLDRHGLWNNGPCAVCNQGIESVDHLQLGCVYSREVWLCGLQPCGWQHLTLLAHDNLASWWLQSLKIVMKAGRPAFDSLCLLIAQSLWLEWNTQVFAGTSRPVKALAAAMGDLAALWCRSYWEIRLWFLVVWGASCPM
jgi:hypothetical protein